METDSSESKPAVSVPPYAWVILLVVFIASVAAPLNQTKVSPLLNVIREHFNMSLAMSGYLNSVFSLTGLILAIPTGIFLKKYGPKLMGIVAMSFLIVGAVLGAISKSAGFLIFSRIIEGNGMGLISVVGPAAISIWFPPEKRGIPMGIWATWFPVGLIIMYIFAPRMAIAWGWKSVWWFSAIFALVALILYAMFMKMPPQMKDVAAHKHQVSIISELISSIKILLKNKAIWLLGLGFACYNLVNMSIGTFYPSFLNEVRGYSLENAALISCIGVFVLLFSAPLAGIVSDKIGSRRLLFSIPMLAMAVVMLLPFKVIGWQIFALMTFNGVIAGSVPTATFAAAPEIMRKPELASLGLAVVMAGSNLGMVIGPILFGNIVDKLGWVHAGYCLIPFCILGFITMWIIKVR